MAHELITAWRTQKWKKRPYIFNEDRDCLFEKTHCFASYQKFITDEKFPDHHKGHFHVGLIPVPFHGCLECADIFICLINPGFGLIDYYSEDRSGYRSVLLRNLKQHVRSDPYPFFSLDPVWRWTGSGKWWHSLLQGVIRGLKTEKNISYETATKDASRRVAALELVPYHSSGAGHVEGLAKKLKSSLLVKDFVCREIVPKAVDGAALLVIAGGVRMWGVEEGPPNILHSTKSKVPKANLSMEPGGAGWAILKRLLREPPKSLPARCARPGNK